MKTVIIKKKKLKLNFNYLFNRKRVFSLKFNKTYLKVKALSVTTLICQIH